MGATPRLLLTALLFVLIFITGFMLSRAGKPYGTAVFTLHKLIGLAAFIFLVLTLYRWDILTAANGLLFTVALLTVIAFVALLVTGGIISAKSEVSALVMTAHRVLPWLTVVMSGLTLFLARR